MPRSPRVLHLNDCAFVGRHIVTAARDSGRPWRIIPPEKSWPAVRPGRTKPSKPALARTFARIAAGAAWSQAMHVHFATTASRVLPWFVPSRPYVLHLHGTDIRTRWASSEHAKIQSYIDQAAHVFYSTPDLAGNATQARSDAEYLPIFIDPRQLPLWRPQPYVAFSSRWEDVKGQRDMLTVARGLIAAGVEVRGLDWGPGAAEAAALGVKLEPRMSHPDYLDFLSHASVAVGQSNSVLGVSELEALAIGVPLAAVGDHLPGPDGGRLPIREGTPAAVTEQVLRDLSDPRAASAELAADDWARTWHTAARYLPQLDETYRRIIRHH
ncbi:glycosyltransferase [Microbacterium arborescens]|uniref:glycosyltransferase n=1 Tax=Microbacterium arborescens TaxID=33883 RepID=UPI000DF7C541|nr:glycosyltransferase [Microbacterium arborescens]